MHAEIVRVFRFEAAQFLPHVPKGHGCGRMHGHSYAVDVHVAGDTGAEGWVIDFSVIEGAFDPIARALDHRVLNEIDGLANPTAECVAAWIWRCLLPSLPALVQVVVHETNECRAIYRGP